MVTLAPYQLAHAIALRAYDKSHRAGKIGMGIAFAGCIRAEYPYAVLTEHIHRLRYICHLCTGQPAGSACRGLEHSGVEGCAPSLGDDYPVSPRCLRSTDDSAEIMRILYLIAYDNERCCALAL